MRLASFSLRNLVRRPLRSALTAAGIAVAVGSLIALTGLSRGVETAWRRAVDERGAHLLAIQGGVISVLNAAYDAGAAPELARIEGVRDVAGELVDVVALRPGYSLLVTGWPEAGFLWHSLRLQRGRLPQAGARAEVVLGEGVAAALGLTAGGRLSIRGREFTVTGVFRPAGVLHNNTIIMPLPVMQELWGRPAQVTVFNLRLLQPADPGAVAAVLARLRAAFPGLTFSELRELTDTNETMKMFRSLTWGVATVALVMGVLAVLNTLLMSITERTREIGILSAIGWPPARILGVIMLEGLALAVAGSAGGALLGLAGLEWLAALPQLQGFLEPTIDLHFVVQVIGVTLALGVLGGVYPAWRAARLNPVDALRYE